MTTSLDEIKTIAEKLRDKLKSFDDFKGLYLYGSQVKGTAKDKSDIDMVAIFDTINHNKKRSIHGYALDIELEYDIFIDLHPMTLEELNLNCFFFDEVKKGIFYGSG